MINYSQKQIWKFILDSIKNGSISDEKVMLEMTKYGLDHSLLIEWYLDMDLEKLIEIPNLNVVLNWNDWGFHPNNDGSFTFKDGNKETTYHTDEEKLKRPNILRIVSSESGQYS